MSNTNMVLGSWRLDEWPEYISRKAGGGERVMEVAMHNGIERCPDQCAFAVIKAWTELRHGPRKASVTGVDVHVTCAHAAVCRMLAEKLAERGQ